MGENNKTIGLSVLTIFVMIAATVGQAALQTNQRTNLGDTARSSMWGGGSIEVWQDEFLNTSRVDFNLSDHIIVDTNVGIVSMDGTYPAWADPSFLRMKPVTITNTGGETFTNYDVNITVLYDSDMQNDFDDIRFTDANGAQLSYYKMKKTNSVSADFLLKVPLIPPGQTMLYMFYGNPGASDQSNFAAVFSWQNRTQPDTMISFKAADEGAWDPSVEYGGNRFLVAWEERLGPEDISVPLPHYERTIPGVIHGRSYNRTGGDPIPIPQNNSDIDISDPDESTTFHAENPTAAYGGGKFFVVWEENPANQPLLRYDADIKGALVTPDGNVTYRFTICSATNGQFNPQVAYDPSSGRFLVVWADARNGYADYDVRGRLYTSNGFPVGPDFGIAYETNYQGDPWVCSDQVGNFFIVYEDGVDSAIGPFSLYAYRYDSNGNRIGSRIAIAIGTSTVDYIFPAVSYNPKIQRFIITWNDGDISVDPNIRDSYDGNIWGKILTRTAGVVKNNYIIEAGTSYIRTDAVPYFDSMFFVAYNGIVSGSQDIFGRLISSNGTIMTNRQELSDGSSLNVDWTTLAVGANRIFAAWEDERDLLSPYADVFGSLWRSAQTIGSANVTYSIGSEVALVLHGQLMSVAIQPEEFRQWRLFYFRDTIPENTILRFDIMDQNGTVPLKLDVQNGENLSDINVSGIRLRATFSRMSAQISPLLDAWNVSAFVGKDIYPPYTTITLTPAVPNGNHSWYISPVTATFNVTDVDSDPQNITTWYSINGYAAEVYHPETPPVISSDGPDNYIDYWSNDSINEEIHHRVSGIKIDQTPPMISLHELPSLVSPGSVVVNGSATEYSTGSGMSEAKIMVNDETIFDSLYSGELHIWFEWNFTADRGETYDIFIEVWDMAGNKIEDRQTVICPDRGLYDPGYIYLFDNPKIGPRQFLLTLGLSIAVNYDTLFVLLPGITSNVSSATFVATQVFLNREFSFTDDNMSDGCSVDLMVPLGVYQIKAYTYDSGHHQLGEYAVIEKMLILLL
jgi:hypothetical protein